MSFDNLKWDSLISQIKNGRCTPFLGAGACDGYFPLGEAIALEWSKAYKFPIKYEKGNLSKVAQFMAIHTGKHLARDLIREKLREKHSQANHASLQKLPHQFLSTLPLPIYMTTNYDNLMFEALEKQEDRAPMLGICRWNPDIKEINLTDPITVKKPLVFHLHGHLNDDNSMVLTEDDYLDFLSNIQLSLLPPPIHAAMTNTSLLFLGYSLNDITFKVLFRGIINRFTPNNKVISFAVQLKKKDKKGLIYLEKYFEQANIKIYWGTAQEFINELQERWKAQL